MELLQLTDRVWYTTHQTYGDRPVLGYLRGDRYSVAVDAGNSAAHLAEFYHLLGDAGLPLPSLTVLTHWHWDHTFAMHAVAGQTVACRKTADQLACVAGWSWDEAAMAARLRSGEDIPFCDGCIREEYPDRSAIRVVTPDLVFTGELDLDLGGLCCHLLEVPSPHCPDNVLVHLPEQGVLFVGDASCGDYYHNGGLCRPDMLADYTELLHNLSFDHSLFGHDAPRSRADEFAALAEEAVAWCSAQKS